MPIAAPTMPSSLIGVSKQRLAPYLRCNPSVQRNTPPKYPASSPNTTTLSSRSIETSIAPRIASIIVILGTASDPRLLALTPQMWRHLREYALEHVAGRRLSAGMQRAVLLRLLLRRYHVVEHLRLGLFVALLRPAPTRDQMVLQPEHGIAERPLLRFRLRPIGGRIVRRRMRPDAIGDIFDQGRSEIATRALGGPSGDRVDREIVVAVDAQRRNAEPESSGGESSRSAASDALEGRNRPLVVDDVQHDWRPIRRGERQGGMKIRLRRSAVADPADRDFRVVLDRRGHRPAHRLDELRREIPRYREEAVLLGGIHHRKLTALERVLFVRKDLVHHFDHRIAAGDQEPGLPVGRKVHVAGFERAPERT